MGLPALRERVCSSGVAPGPLRREVWKFLVGLYPPCSTEQERRDLMLRLRADYQVRGKRGNVKGIFRLQSVEEEAPGMGYVRPCTLASLRLRVLQVSMLSACPPTNVCLWQLRGVHGTPLLARSWAAGRGRCLRLHGATLRDGRVEHPCVVLDEAWHKQHQGSVQGHRAGWHRDDAGITCSTEPQRL